MEYVNAVRLALASSLSLSGCLAAGAGWAANPLGAPGPWHMVFDDEFAGTKLDTSKWNTRNWYSPDAGNAYMNTAYATVNNGLDLKVLPLPGGKTADHTWRAYTGSMVNSYGKFRYSYGVIEVSAKMPGGGQGLDAGAFLLNDSGPGRDVVPPELDIFEVLSSDSRMAMMTYHWRKSGQVHQSGGWFKTPADFSTGYHVFTMDWEPKYIRWYIDGVLRFSYTDAANITSLPMDIIMDPLVCTTPTGWCRLPSGTKIFPAHMDFRYVRVWQH